MRRAIYPGTFDPVTNGHLDLIDRASHIFDEVIVGVSENPNKKKLFKLDERIELLNEVTADMPNVSVKGFDVLLIDFLAANDCSIVLRGLRALSDFEFEFHLASANKRLNPNIETMFMTPAESNHFISSSLVKEIARYGGDIASFVPEHVAQQVIAKYSSR
ncbi:MAG: pantetheine-phosphate adenylyltransferase [Arenicella sp.]